MFSVKIIRLELIMKTETKIYLTSRFVAYGFTLLPSELFNCHGKSGQLFTFKADYKRLYCTRSGRCSVEI